MTKKVLATPAEPTPEPTPEPTSTLRGFEPQYKTISDYIVRITHRIWEEADVGYIYDTYSHQCTVHTPYGVAYGTEDVVSGTVAVLAGFPDRRLFPEDIVWRGDDEAGFYTSHLIFNTATNTGYSPYGPPTGKRVQFYGVAECFVRENRIREEWLVRDTAALVRQLGLDPWEVARRAVRRGERSSVSVYGETDRLRGQLPPASYQATEGEDGLETFVRQLFHDVWNGRHFNRVRETHRADVSMFVPNHLQVKGANNVRTYIMSLIAMFPDAHMNVEDVYRLGDEAAGYRVSVRWRFSGTHGTYGPYGPPTGKRVNVLGLSHLHVQGGQVHKHYFVFDELAVMMQLVDAEIA